MSGSAALCHDPGCRSVCLRRASLPAGGWTCGTGLIGLIEFSR